ncbi:MAG: VPLPA-CTERM sorting domain-containing protein [Pseudomonadota bacterium]
MKILLATMATLACVASAASASQVTIDFTAPDQDLTVSTYSEDGYVVDASGTSFGQIEGEELIEGFFDSSDTFSITREDGGLFSLFSFDHRTLSGTSDEFAVLGLVDDIVVVNFGAFSTNSVTLVTEMIMSMVLIDELQITGTDNIGTATPRWDNFVFDGAAAPVPVPAALPLFLAGVAGFGAMKRRRSAL